MITEQVVRDSPVRPGTAVRGPAGPRNTAVRTLDSLFTRAARRTPDAVAVREGGHFLTYGTADARSAQLATALLRSGVQLGDPVIVDCSDHRQAVVAQLAVLKAGGVCVPVRCDVAASEIPRIAAVSGARTVLCSASTQGRWSADSPRIALDDPDLWKRVGAMRVDRALPRSGLTDAAYLLVTGVDSSMPGGHLVDHRGWQLALAARVRRIGSAPQAVAIAEPPVGPQTLAAMWWAFAGGATLHLGAQDGGFFSGAARHGMGAAVCGVQEYARILEALGGERHRIRPHLSLLTGGPLPGELVEAHFDVLPTTRLWSEFAPAGSVLPWAVREYPPDESASPDPGNVGAPAPEVRLRVVDELGQELDEGGIGELCADGRAVPFDVIGAPDLMFTAQDGSVVLRSGLKCRRRAGGTVELA